MCKKGRSDPTSYAAAKGEDGVYRYVPANLDLVASARRKLGAEG